MKQAPKSAQAKRPELQFAFQRKNYLFLMAGVLVIIIGFLLMSGGGSPDPNVFDESIFSFRRITLAPIVVLLGFVVVGYGIMYKPRKAETSAPKSV